MQASFVTAPSTCQTPRRGRPWVKLVAGVFRLAVRPATRRRPRLPSGGSKAKQIEDATMRPDHAASVCPRAAELVAGQGTLQPALRWPERRQTGRLPVVSGPMRGVT